MFRFLLLLILPTLLFASNTFLEPTPSQVLVVYPENSVLDTDTDGVADWVQELSALITTWGSVPNQLGITFRPYSNNFNHPQQGYWDNFCSTFDSSVFWGSVEGQSAPYEYPVDEICEWFDADSANRWGHVIYILLLGDCPRAYRSIGPGTAESPNTGVPADYPDATTYRSMAQMLWQCVSPHMVNAKKWNLHWGERRTNPYFDQVTASNNWNFIAGTLYSKCVLHGVAADSLRLWVMMPTVLNGNHVDDVIGAIQRSTSHILPASGIARSNLWAVFDETYNANASLYTEYAPYYRFPGLDDTLQVAFPSHVLVDIDSVAEEDIGKTYIGWDDPLALLTLNSGDTCAFFHNAASKHTIRPENSANWYSQITFKIAAGAMTYATESYFEYTAQRYDADGVSLRPGGEQTQSLGCEALHAGFTYTLGNCEEPFNLGIPHVEMMVNGMRIPHLTFAQIASASSFYSFSPFLGVGSPIGYFREGAPIVTPPTSIFAGHCGEKLIFSEVPPDGVDSLNLILSLLNGGALLDTTLIVTAGVLYSFTYGTQWISAGKDSVEATWIYADGTRHPTLFIK